MNRMLDFHSNEIKSNLLSRFTELLYKSSEYLYISLLMYKIEVGSELVKIVEDLSMILIG